MSTTNQKTIKNERKQAKAILRHANITPKKLRKVTKVIKGMSVNEAEAQLSLMTRRGSDIMLKLLRSAMANGENNQDMTKERMFIKEIRVDEGRKIKRLFPRAFGRADIKLKRMSHIVLILEDRDTKKPSRFVIPEKIIEEKIDEPQKDDVNDSVSEEQEERIDQKKEDTSKKIKQSGHDKDAKPKKSKQGFVDKVFRRKSI